MSDQDPKRYQLGSSYKPNNKQTFLDNLTFAIFILWIYSVSAINASPLDTQREVTAYSAGMLIAVFTAALPMFALGQSVFDDNPEFLTAMSTATVAINLTLARQFVPFVDLVVNPMGAACSRL